MAAVALVLLLVHILSNPEGNLKTAFILFVIAAVAGFYMFFRDLKGKFSPIWLAIIHAIVAVVAFVLVLLTVI
jgi:Trk-type K+ transport system membrane component